MDRLMKHCAFAFCSISAWSRGSQRPILMIGQIKGLDTQGRFSAIFTNGGNFCVFLFAFLCAKPSHRKGSTLKGKNLLLRSKFFPFRVDPLLTRETKTFLTQLPPSEVCRLLLKDEKVKQNDITE